MAKSPASRVISASYEQKRKEATARLARPGVSEWGISFPAGRKYYPKPMAGSLHDEDGVDDRS